MTQWLLRYELWLIAALVLIAIDVFLGLDFFLLAFGVGAAVTGASLFFKDSLPLPYTGNWEALLTFFAVFSLIILIPLRRLLQKAATNGEASDINRY
jgi:membrane protein implicated in regulation of membrane protease activity